jgi:hypothetical protein
MKGDFTRDSFDPSKHFTRVLQQQGRVQLDADSNEQVSIFWHYIRALIRDMLGPYAAPRSFAGFGLFAASEIDGLKLGAEETDRLKALLAGPEDFLVGPGRYYVNGLLCENETYYAFSRQPDLKAAPLQFRGKNAAIVLDVWERHITYVEDGSIQEVALWAADTSTRAKLVCQVRIHELAEKPASPADLNNRWNILLEQWEAKNRGSLKARAKQNADNEEPCTISLTSRYRGPENQLYRIEIHHGGQAIGSGSKEGATFKWSRDNGSVSFPIVAKVEGEIIELANLGRDARFGLEVGDWVEVVDDDYILHGKADPLLRIEHVDAGAAQVTLSGLRPAKSVGISQNIRCFVVGIRKAGIRKRAALNCIRERH